MRHGRSVFKPASLLTLPRESGGTADSTFQIQGVHSQSAVSPSTEAALGEMGLDSEDLIPSTSLTPLEMDSKLHRKFPNQLNALLVYPKCPPTYWGFNFALEFSEAKSLFPPLGLLTVAAMFPARYNIRVVDMNVGPLVDEDIQWADIVFISAMIVQQDSMRLVVSRCNSVGVHVAAGGPYPTSYHDEIEGVDYFLLDEVEDTFPEFLNDLENGVEKAIYRESSKPDITSSPIPRFDLINLEDYHAMSVQFSRGCPFDCEFCDITKLFGRVPRTKSPKQLLSEFDFLFHLGWKGQLFLVDDNFIGNKRKALELLYAVAEWQKLRNYPFNLITETTVNLANSVELMSAMVSAGFHTVFLGIETPNPKALVKTKKRQNTSKKEEDYLFIAVRRIQARGIRVAAGFILGLDEDDETVFETQVRFIQQAGIPMAMVGLLTVLRGTDLHTRMEAEDRLLDINSTGHSFNLAINFKPQMDPEILLNGYRRVLTTIYDSTLENYFDRCLTMLRNVKARTHPAERLSWGLIRGGLKWMFRQTLSNQRMACLEFFVKVSRIDPRLLPEAMFLSILGYHFQMVASQEIAVYDFKNFLKSELCVLEQTISNLNRDGVSRVERVDALIGETLSTVDSHYGRIHSDFRGALQGSLGSFLSSVNEFRQVAWSSSGP